MTEQANWGVVIDVEGELLPHQNGPRCQRLVLSPAEAKVLRESLNKMFNNTLSDDELFRLARVRLADNTFRAKMNAALLEDAAKMGDLR